MMDAKVIDAGARDNTKDHQEGLDNFNFNNVLDKESNYAFVQEVAECSPENEVVLDLRGNDCTYNQEHHEGEDFTDILLDNQSTVHMMVNPKLLKNIRKSEQMLRLYTNAGMARVTHTGDMPRLGVCWYYEDGIANVVFQAKAVRENGFEIDYSTRQDKNGSGDLTFCVETKEG